MVMERRRSRPRQQQRVLPLDNNTVLVFTRNGMGDAPAELQ